MIRPNFHVPYLEDQLAKFCAACSICSQFKANTARKVTVGHAPLPASKCQTWHLDFVVKMPPKDGFDSYLSILDPFSGFRLAIATKSTITAQGVTKILREHVLMHYGIPSLLVSDGGPQLLKSTELTRFCQFYGIERHIGLPYHPPSHGTIEASNRVISEAVAMLSAQYETAWTRLLSIAVHKLNSRPRAHLGGMTPYFIVFGREAPPLQVAGQEIPNMDPAVHRLLFQDLDRKLKELLNQATKSMMEANRAKGGLMTYIRPGTAVYIKDFRRKNKMNPRFLTAPLVVLHDYGQAILVKNSMGIISVVHKANVKVAREREQAQFDALPIKVKALLGEPFTYQEVQEAYEAGRVPKFWEEKPPEKPDPAQTRRQTREREEKERQEAEENTWITLPFPADESDEEVEESNQTTLGPKRGRTVRFLVD